jgi:hypothetical protein
MDFSEYLRQVRPLIYNKVKERKQKGIWASDSNEYRSKSTEKSGGINENPNLPNTYIRYLGLTFYSNLSTQILLLFFLEATKIWANLRNLCVH